MLRPTTGFSRQLRVDSSILSRELNVGFSGSEKKNLEML